MRTSWSPEVPSGIRSVTLGVTTRSPGDATPWNGAPWRRGYCRPPGPPSSAVLTTGSGGVQPPAPGLGPLAGTAYAAHPGTTRTRRRRCRGPPGPARMPSAHPPSWQRLPHAARCPSAPLRRPAASPGTVPSLPNGRESHRRAAGRHVDAIDPPSPADPQEPAPPDGPPGSSPAVPEGPSGRTTSGPRPSSPRLWRPPWSPRRSAWRPRWTWQAPPGSGRRQGPDATRGSVTGRRSQASGRPEGADEAITSGWVAGPGGCPESTTDAGALRSPTAPPTPPPRPTAWPSRGAPRTAQAGRIGRPVLPRRAAQAPSPGMLGRWRHDRRSHLPADTHTPVRGPDPRCAADRRASLGSPTPALKLPGRHLSPPGGTEDRDGREDAPPSGEWFHRVLLGPPAPTRPRPWSGLPPVQGDGCGSGARCPGRERRLPPQPARRWPDLADLDARGRDSGAGPEALGCAQCCPAARQAISRRRGMGTRGRPPPRSVPRTLGHRIERRSAGQPPPRL